VTGEAVAGAWTTARSGIVMTGGGAETWATGGGGRAGSGCCSGGAGGGSSGSSISVTTTGWRCSFFTNCGDRNVKAATVASPRASAPIVATGSAPRDRLYTERTAGA
jgi:hypothetical protein